MREELNGGQGGHHGIYFSASQLDLFPAKPSCFTPSYFPEFQNQKSPTFSGRFLSLPLPNSLQPKPLCISQMLARDQVVPDIVAHGFL